MDPKTLARYEILEPIGKGAMGIVYKARDPRIDRLLVLKTLRSDVLEHEDSEAFVKRFYREAMAAGKLSHPSIVTIHDVDRDEEAGIDFIAMEYVPGVSLQELLTRGQRLSPARVISMARQIADALDFAHSRGVVHRDIKPGNIILRDDGVVKITDFGIARLETSDLTRTGEYVGTPNYMSPEQVTGESVDGKADQFSLAIVLYQLLTGVRPFSGENLTAITYRIVHEEPTPPISVGAGVPAGASAALMRGLSKSREARFDRCQDLVDAVAAGLAGEAAAVPLPSVEDAAPATVVAVRRRRAAVPEPLPTPRDVRPADDREGDYSGATLSLRHELDRLQSGAPARRSASPAAADDDGAFSMDDAEATHLAGSGPEVAPHDERTEALGSGSRPGATAAAPSAAFDDERTRMADPSIPLAGGGELAATSAAPVSPRSSGARAPVRPSVHSEVTEARSDAFASDAEATVLGEGPPSFPPMPAPAPPISPRPLPRAGHVAPSPSAGVATGGGSRTTLIVVALLFVGFLLVAGGALGAWWLLRPATPSVGLTPTSPPTFAPSPTAPTLAPTPAPTVDDAVARHFETGVLAYTEGRLDDAEAELSQVLAVEPGHAAASDYMNLIREDRARLATPALTPTVEALPLETPEPAPTATPEPTKKPAPTKAADPGRSTPPASDDDPKGDRAASGGKGATIVVAFKHLLKEGELVVKVDGKERLREQFESERPGIARPFIKTKGEYAIEVAPGDHQVQVRVVAPKNKVDTEGTRTLSLSAGAECTLRIGVGRFDRDIEMKDDCH